MQWKPITAGVDGSHESVAAANFAGTLARAMGVSCHPVHAVTDFWLWSGIVRVPAYAPELAGELVTETRERMRATLKADGLAPALFRSLEIEIGRPARVLADAVARHRAGLVVLGGKHHGAVARAFGGSTARDLLRISDVPVWVSRAEPGRVRRILVALDLSEASAPTLALAERYAALLDADVRALHVLEPPPAALPARSLASIRPHRLDVREFSKEWEAELDRLRAGAVEMESALKTGPAAETIASDAEEWKADLIVLGSHGRGWVDRILLGSTTERVLRLLPTSLLIVPPVGVGRARRAPRAKRVRRAARSTSAPRRKRARPRERRGGSPTR